MMKDDAAHCDGVTSSRAFGPKTKIHVFAAVGIAFVEPAEFSPECALNEEACSCDGLNYPRRLDESHPERRKRAFVLGLSLVIKKNSRVVDRASASVALDITDDASSKAKLPVGRQHRLQPVWREHEIIVQQEQEISSGDRGTAVVRGGVAEIRFVENNAVSRAEAGQPQTRSIRAAIVDENDLMRKIAWQRGV